MSRLLAGLPLLILVAAIGLAWAAGWRGALSWSALAAHEAALRATAASHPFLAPAGFALLYATVVALSIPNAWLLSIAGGLVLGAAPALFCIVPGATGGAVLLFLTARSAFGGRLRGRMAPRLERIRPGLERDGFSYLLALRLLPMVPYALLNFGPALVGMRLAPFAAATAIGITPAAVFFAMIGAGLGDTLAAGRPPHIWEIFTPQAIALRVGLALLALLPVLWRLRRRRHG